MPKQSKGGRKVTVSVDAKVVPELIGAAESLDLTISQVAGRLITAALKDMDVGKNKEIRRNFSRLSKDAVRIRPSRINLFLTPENLELVQRLSVERKVSISHVIRDALEGAINGNNGAGERKNQSRKK